ncbi:MAG: HAD family hydrolase [Gammaproteobacteria bacterium]|nr:HAD family hydrolase [Gammaproteobacteria bacterium]
MSGYNKIKLICFDLDDTLWPCMPTIIKAENRLYQWLCLHKPAITRRYSLEDLRLKRLALASQRADIKHNLTELRKASLRALCAEFNDDSGWVDDAFDVFYKARQEVEFYADVEPVLSCLKEKYHLASITNGNADIHRTSLGHLFDYAFAAETAGAAKPDATMFMALVKTAAVSADEVLFIGDHPVDDIEASRAAGMTNIWLNRQAMQWPHESFKPDHSLQTLYEILPLLGLDRI